MVPLAMGFLFPGFFQVHQIQETLVATRYFTEIIIHLCSLSNEDVFFSTGLLTGQAGEEAGTDTAPVPCCLCSVLQTLAAFRALEEPR